MKIIYKKADFNDIDELIKIRIEQLKEEGAKADFDLSGYLNIYYKTHIIDNSFVSWIAKENDKIIATSGITFTHKPPYYSNPYGNIGIISSMYTNKNYRRMGIAKELLNKIINEAKLSNCNVVQLKASDMGVFLYENYGFKKNENFMYYEL